jgi:1-deoxy-D-xylulose-5-phosphate reductoisomerase
MRLALLGSTGSIGQNTLEIVQTYPDEFRIVVLGCRSNLNRLMEQAEHFRPEWVTVDGNTLSDDQRNTLKSWGIRIAVGTDELRGVLKEASYDLAVNAIMGSAGLIPTIDVLERGVDVALANKESLVMAGRLVMDLAKEREATVFPIDSEHSAIQQCLRGEDTGTVARIILTASGGPFYNDSSIDLSKVTIKEVLNHPTWDMGPKITVDSATLMNKGLEVIEAHFLFDIPPESIEVWIHPQSIVHSMVEFVDGSIKAQLGTPDMRLPILYALTGGNRHPADFIHTDLCKIGKLEFAKPDRNRFPCLGLAYHALELGGTAPAVLSSADEEAVMMFLNGEITFDKIPKIVSGVVDSHSLIPEPGIDDILKADHWARNQTKQLRL